MREITFSSHPDQIIQDLGKDRLLEHLTSMLLVRNFEMRAESAYLQGKIGGFFHAYIGQEAIQTASIAAAGTDHFWSTSYRCHALALLLGVDPKELMAELYGKETGNAKGRGGSMHFFAKNLLGGFGIVGGQVPIATGAGFTIKYKQLKDKVSFCFLGDGAVAQGAFHESLNLASLWHLPCLYIVENNQWGMGTAVGRALAAQPIAKAHAGAYDISFCSIDGMDFFHCYSGIKAALAEIKATSKPVLIEASVERFRGHSISDPGLYRSKEALKHCMERDPLSIMFKTLSHYGIVDEERYKVIDKEQKDIVLEAMRYAEESSWPDLITLEEGVYAP